MVHLFGAILNDATISLRKAFCLVLRCLSDVLEGSSFIILPRASLFVGRVGRFKLYHSASCFAVCRTCWKVQALSFCLVLRCLSDVLEGSSFIAVWSVSYFVMLLKNFVGVIYQSLRKVCATSGPCTSTRTRFVLNGSPCLIELTRCGRKSNQPSSIAWPLCQPTRCGHKTNQPNSVAWWPLCQPTRCGRKTNQPSSVVRWPLCQPTRCGPSNAAWLPLRCGLKRNELSRGARWPLSQLNCITNLAVLVTNKVKLAVYQNVTILSVRSGTQNPSESLITGYKNCMAGTACSEYSLESSINFEKGELLKETMNRRRKKR